MNLDKWQGVFFLGAIGDACGHMKSRNGGLCEYSDDTVLTLATAAALRFCKVHGWTANNVMKVTQDYVRKDEATRVSLHPRNYGEKTFKLFNSWHVNSAHEKGNWDTCGLVMKISPLACLKIIPSLSDVAIAGHFTHGKNETAVLVAWAHVCMVKWLMESGDVTREQVLTKIDQLFATSNDPFLHASLFAVKHLPFIPAVSPYHVIFNRCGRTKAVVVYFCAIWFVLPHLTLKGGSMSQTFRDVMTQILTVDSFHDTDTIAKLAGELLGAKFGWEKLKGDWFANWTLENVQELAATAKMCFEF